MSDNGATTTQGQSIPTALFDKMFGKDNGMPGRDELLSTMQDRSTLKRPGNVTAYDGRPLFCLRTVIDVEQASAQELPTSIPTIPACDLVRGSTGRGVR